MPSSLIAGCDALIGLCGMLMVNGFWWGICY